MYKPFMVLAIILKLIKTQITLMVMTNYYMNIKNLFAEYNCNKLGELCENFGDFVIKQK